MAKATILICDWCRTQEPAKGTVDLCGPHLKEARKRKRVLAKSAPRKKQKYAPPRQRQTIDYGELNTKIMELAESRPLFTGADVVRTMQTKPYVTMMAVRLLIKAGKLESTGKGAGRKLSKAS